jgi:hypothetical protein
MTEDLTIDGPNANQLTVSGGNATRVFHVSGSATHLAIDGLTVADGRASVPGGNALGGGLLNDGASVSLARVVFRNNQAVGPGAGGAAVANIGGGHLTADHTDFLGNTSHGADDNFAFGAVLDDQGSFADIAHGTFSGNGAFGGNSNDGAIGVAGGSQLALASCDFEGNQSQGGPGVGDFGGGVNNGRLAGAGPSPTQASTLELIACTVSANLAIGGAGGVGGNDGFARGGGIYNGNTGGTGSPQPGTAVLDLDGTGVTANRAVGGAAGSGGVTGSGEGGGLYSQLGAVAEADADSGLKGNKASNKGEPYFAERRPGVFGFGH